MPEPTIIDVEATERWSDEPRQLPAVPDLIPQPDEQPLSFSLDPREIMRAQRELLREQQRALQEMLTRFGTRLPCDPVARLDARDLLDHSMTTLDRSIAAIMSALERTFEPRKRGSTEQEPNR
jgi:hypothetical protein